MRGIPQADIVILNYDILDKWAEVLSKFGHKAIIFDESHYIKNPHTRRTKAAKAVSKDVPIRLLLSGTPILNRPMELVSQLEVMGRMEEFGTLVDFEYRYAEGRNLVELNDLLRSTCFVRRIKADVLKDLPPKQRTYIPVDIDNREEYEKAEQDVVQFVAEQAAKDEDFLATLAGCSEEEIETAIQDHKFSASDRAARAETLVKIATCRRLAAQGKLAAVQRWIKEWREGTDAKLVIFAQGLPIQDAVYQALPGAARVYGSDDVSVRQRNVDRFQNDPACAEIVCSLKAGGVGITLTAASNVVFVEQGWNPSDHNQAEDRCHRIGPTGLGERLLPGSPRHNRYVASRVDR